MFEQMMLKSLLYHDKDALKPRYYLIKVTSNYMFKATQEDGWSHTCMNVRWAKTRAISHQRPMGDSTNLTCHQHCAAAAMNSSKSQVTSGSDANGSVPGCDVKVSRCSLGSANNHAVMRRRLRTKSHWSREKKWRIKIGVMEDGWPTTLHGNIVRWIDHHLNAIRDLKTKDAVQAYH